MIAPHRLMIALLVYVLLLPWAMVPSIAQLPPRPLRRMIKSGRGDARTAPLAPAGTYQDAVAAGARSPVNESEKEKKHKVRGDAPCLCWVKAGVPKRAVVVCIHGLGLNSSSWEQLGQRLSQAGVVTYAIDVRGFGSWMEAKGHHDVDFKACLADVKSTLQWVRKANPNLPVFLLGESMGGAIALQSTAAFPELIDGLISACASGDRFKQKKMDLNVALHALVPGGFRRNFNIGTSIVDQATDNPELKSEWEGDPLNRLKLSPKELLQFQKFMNENHDAAKLIINTPVLMVQGSKDGLVKPEGTEELFAELATPDKELLMVPNAEHLIFEEGQFTEGVLRSVADWVHRHPSLQVSALPQDGGGLGPAGGGFVQRQGRPVAGAPGRFLPPAVADALAGSVPPPMANALAPPGSGAPPSTEPMPQTRVLTGVQPSFPGGSSNSQSPSTVAPSEGSNGAASAGSGEPASGGAVGPPLAGVPGQFLDLARQQLSLGKFQQARRTLEAELQIDPDNAEAHMLLGQSFMKTQEYQRARAHFRKAIRSGHGTHHAMQANQMMMTLPRDVLAPQMLVSALTNAPLPLGRRRQGRRGPIAGAEFAPSQPTVIVFNAKWCEPGKDMAAVVAQAQQRFGDKVKFIQIDVDDPKNEKLIDQYSIGPVPTTIFLTPQGEVAAYNVGFAGIDGMIDGMAKIVQLSAR